MTESLEQKILSAIYKARWIDRYSKNKPEALATDQDIADAVLAAISTVSTEFGVLFPTGATILSPTAEDAIATGEMFHSDQDAFPVYRQRLEVHHTIDLTEWQPLING